MLDKHKIKTTLVLTATIIRLLAVFYFKKVQLMIKAYA